MLHIDFNKTSFVLLFFPTSAQRKGYRERERESLAVVAVSAPRIKLVGEVDELASSDNITAWGGVLHTRIYTYTRGLSRQTATLILHSYCVCVYVCVWLLLLSYKKKGVTEKTRKRPRRIVASSADILM